MKRNFTQEEKNKRAFLRVTRVIYDLWEEGSGIHTRILDWLIKDEIVTIGVSLKGKGHREHVVPCVAIIKKCKEMFDEGETVYSVATMIRRNLKIVHITKEEAKIIDSDLGFKVDMPPDWSFSAGNIFERLDMAGIKYHIETE